MTEEQFYHLGIGGENHGPYSLAEIKELLEKGQVQPEDFIWIDEQWMPLQLFPELCESPAVSPEMTEPVGKKMAEQVEPIVVAETTHPEKTIQVSEPEPAPATAAVTSMPAGPLAISHCENHSDQEALFMCITCHKDFCKKCMLKWRGKYVCHDCYATSSLGSAVKELKVYYAIPAIIMALICGYYFKMYAILTVGSGLCLGLLGFTLIHKRLLVRLAIMVLLALSGGAAYYFQVGL